MTSRVVAKTTLIWKKLMWTKHRRRTGLVQTDATTTNVIVSQTEIVVAQIVLNPGKNLDAIEIGRGGEIMIDLMTEIVIAIETKIVIIVGVTNERAIEEGILVCMRIRLHVISATLRVTVHHLVSNTTAILHAMVHPLETTTMDSLLGMARHLAMIAT